MKYGVIDVGSNSVRLMISDGERTLYKLVNTTRLAEGMGEEKTLKAQSVDRTVSAVSFFVEKAKFEYVSNIYIFATAAVRMAKNRQFFTDKVKAQTGIDVDVISGEYEAYIGRLGALSEKDGGIIDVGGASTEVITVLDGQTVYSKSLDIGAVKIKDNCGQNRAITQDYIKNKILEYGEIPKTVFYSIGGTATTLASILLELEPYDPERVDGFKLAIEDLEKLIDKLYSLSIEQRKALKGLQPARAEVIAGGALLLLSIMKKIKIDSVIVSEKDNLEGYLICKRRENEQKN